MASRWFLALIGGIAVGLAGCAGGQTGSPPAVPATTPAPVRPAAIRVVIPNAPTAAAARTPRFIGSTAKSIKIVPSSGTTVQASVASGSSNCTTTSTGRVCTIAVTAPAGSVSYTITVYNGALTGGTVTGTVIAAGTAAASTVTSDAANVVAAVTLGGVVAAVDIDAAATLQSRTAYTATPLTIRAYDADGNQILAPGGFATSTGAADTVTMSVANSASGVSFSLNGAAGGSSATVSSSSDSVTLTLPATTALGLPLNVVNSSGTALPRRSDLRPQSIPFSVTSLTATQVGTYQSVADYASYAPVNTTFTSNVPAGVLINSSYQSGIGYLGYYAFGNSSVTQCSVGADIGGMTNAPSGVYYSYGSNTVGLAGTQPYGMKYLPTANITNGGNCGGTVYATRTDTTSTSAFATSLLYDTGTSLLFALENGAGSPINYHLSTFTPSISSETILATLDPATSGNSFYGLVALPNGTKFFISSGSTTSNLYQQTGASAPTFTTVSGASFAAITTAWDGNVYAYDTSSGGRIWRWNGSGSPVLWASNIGGSIAGGSVNAYNLAIGPDGNAYLGETTGTVRRTLHTVGGGTSLSTSVSHAINVFTGTDGVLYAFDAYDGYVIKLTF